MTSYTVSIHDVTESEHSVTASHLQIGTPGYQNMRQRVHNTQSYVIDNPFVKEEGFLSVRKGIERELVGTNGVMNCEHS